MSELTKREREELILSIIIDEEVKSANEVLNILRGRGESSSIASVGRDIKFLMKNKKIRRNPVTQCYVAVEKESKTKQEETLKSLLIDIKKKSLIMMLQQETEQILIKVDPGAESLISKLIYELYNERLFGIVPGVGCVIIYAIAGESNNIKNEILALTGFQ